MSNYKQTTVSGESWQRAVRVIVENPLNATPSVMFVEQEVVVVGEKTIVKDVANLRVSFNPTQTFPAYDPQTGLVTDDNFTHADIYAVLYSLYMHHANQRDTEAENGEGNQTGVVGGGSESGAASTGGVAP